MNVTGAHMPTEPLHLIESHEWSGLWWLPDAPDERVPGVLRYDRDGGAELTLIGTFEGRVMTSPRPGVTHVHEGTRSWDVILGVAQNREITLLGCIPTSTKRSFGARVKSPDKQVVSAQSALIGVHTANTEAALFEGLQISVEDVGRWAADGVFSSSIGGPGGTPIDGSGSIRAKPLESTSVLVDGTEYSLQHLRNPPYVDELRGRMTARIRDTVFLQIAPPDAWSFEEALESAKSLQDLISLATHRAAGVIWLRLKLKGDGPGPNGIRWRVMSRCSTRPPPWGSGMQKPSSTTECSSPAVTSPSRRSSRDGVRCVIASGPQRT